MSSRIADVAVPPRCNEMIRAGALVAINTSGGKDSQAMTILLSRMVPPTQLVAVHAPLGEVEWPGTVEHIEASALGLARPAPDSAFRPSIILRTLNRLPHIGRSASPPRRLRFPVTGGPDRG